MLFLIIYHYFILRFILTRIFKVLV